MKYICSLGVVLMGTWLLWSGHFEPLLISLGVLSVALVVALTHRMDVIDHEGAPVDVSFRLFSYLPWLAWQVIIANLQVVRVILSPSLPINPRMIDVRATQKRELGHVIYANSITMTPGTVSVEVGGNTISVHALTDEAAEGLETGEMDRRVTRLEGIR